MPLSIENVEVREFIAFLQLKNVSVQTIAHYRWTIKDFLRFCPSSRTVIPEITALDLREYVARQQAKKLADKTINDRVTILKRFFGYLVSEGHLSTDPSERLPVPKVGKRLPKALTLEETQALLAAIKDDSDLGRRDKALFDLLYATGLRVSEAVGLRVEDIDFSDGSLRVVGKGDQERRIYLKPAHLRSPQTFIQRAHVEIYLFTGYDQGHLNRRSVELRLKRYVAAAGIAKRVSPHTLRHSIAVHYLQGGAPINFVQGLLGHASLATTGKYLQLTDAMAKRIAISVPTALEPRRVSAKKKIQGELREAPPGYRTEAEPDWDAQVAIVLEWLTRG